MVVADQECPGDRGGEGGFEPAGLSGGQLLDLHTAGPLQFGEVGESATVTAVCADVEGLGVAVSHRVAHGVLELGDEPRVGRRRGDHELPHRVVLVDDLTDRGDHPGGGMAGAVTRGRVHDGDGLTCTA